MRAASRTTPRDEASWSRRGEGSRRSLRARLRVAFAIAFVLFAATGGAAVASLIELHSASDHLTDRVSPARIAAGTLATSYLDQESGVNGYAVSRRPEFLQPYRAGREREAQSAGQVRDLLGTNPIVAGALDDVGTAARKWRREFAEPAIAEISAAPPSAEVAIDAEVGRARFDELRAATDALNATLAAERVAARGHLGAAINRLRVLFAVAATGAVIAALVLWQATRRAVTAPLERLATQTRLVAAGDFTRQVEVGGPKEIAGLGGDVDSMRRRLVAAYDVSEQARDELRSQAAQLAAQTELLAARAQDLARSNDELEQFAYVASHDLQEPLRKVASFCQMLERRYAGQLDERADQYIAFAVDGAKRMQVLINDLLSFSRVGRTAERMTQIDTGALAERVMESLAETAAQAGAQIEIAPLPTLHGEESLLTQLFQNVLGNAIKFRSPQRPCRVRLSAIADGEHWHFRCADNGIGIEEQYAERVFVIFQRLHTKDEYPGTGIGLSLCKKIVEYHGGTIWLEGAPGGGTAVHWTLPARPSQYSPVRTAGNGSAASTPGGEK